MARHAQPREIAKLKGATRKDPQRYRNEPPKSTQPIGEAPDHLTAAEKACWFEVSSLCAKGVLTGADRIHLELTSSLLAEFRETKKAFPSSKITHLRGCIAQLGMTPADRQKLGAPEPDDTEDDYSKY